MLRKLIINNHEITYTLRKSRRAKRLKVAVFCDASVVVTLPRTVTVTWMEEFLKRKVNWILKEIKYFKKLDPKLRLRGGAEEYRGNRAEALALVMKKIAKVNAVYNFPFRRVTIKNQKTRWGSCSLQGNLNFNYKIIFLPDRAAEYLVAHELAHLEEYNHSKDFWRLVERAVPDYREQRQELAKRMLM